MPAVWTIGSFDSCVHQSEEVKDAKKSVPIGILVSISVCWILGWLMLICICACMSNDIEHVVNNLYGFAMAQVIYDSLGRNWAIAFMSLMAFCQFLMGSSILTAVSRQVWAFARDDGFPMSHYIKKVDKKYSVPFIAIFTVCCGSLVLGLLCLIDNAATSALFSLSVAGNNLAWSMPTFMRLTWGRDLFRPGPFYLGKFLSPIAVWISIFLRRLLLY